MYRKETVFVYGTLKRGFPNHFFLRQAAFLGEAATVGRHALYVEDYPLVVRDEEVSRIRGEVYRVGRMTLDRLDVLEGHPEEYRRQRTEVELDDGRRIEAWMYFHPEAKGELQPGGVYLGLPVPERRPSG